MEINFCPLCGENQRAVNLIQERERASFLIVLCFLTIMGSLFTMGRAYLYEMIFLMDDQSNYFRGWIYGASSIGTFIGAIMMIQRKLKGLYLYSISQCLYIITVLVASVSYSNEFNGSDAIASGIAMFFLIPSVAFLIMYWTNMIRKHLS
ncbi:MAG: hypothetical protein ACKVJF_01785 [Flavobacteriales bacterium]